jgi:hypothetical protein
VTLRQGTLPHGFFRLSSVVDVLRCEAWLRLIAHRSGGGKACNEHIHAFFSLLGGARPVAAFMPSTKGSMAHNLRLASWKAATPASFEAYSLGTDPQGRRLFLVLSSHDVTLPKPVDWLPVASHVEIAGSVGNAVTFLPSILHAGRVGGQRVTVLFPRHARTFLVVS